MKLDKFNPWNWFKHEDQAVNSAEQVPVLRSDVRVPSPLFSEDPLTGMHRELDQMFDNVFRSFGMPSLNRSWLESRRPFKSDVAEFIPSIDISGDEKKYEITLDVPGLSEADLSIEVKDDVLTISGKKDERSENEDKHFYRVERRYGSFQRTLALPKDADVDGIRAQLKEGVLSLEIPRSAVEAQEVKKIEIA